jgi:hypothetical protein
MARDEIEPPTRGLTLPTSGRQSWRCSFGGPSADAVETLATCLRELIEAIKAAKDVWRHLTIPDVMPSAGALSVQCDAA